MRPFNVTQIVPDGYVHAHALDDCAEYLAAMLVACGQRVVRSTNHIDLEAWNLIVGGHLLAEAHVAALPADTLVFNSEQLAFVGNPLITPAYRMALARFPVWDYSATNLPFLPPGRATLIPFAHCPAMVRADRAREPGDALVFHGAVTARRQRILDRLRTAGVRLEVAFGEYGTSRDVRMFRARAVLDLRKEDDTAAFTPIRCFYPLINGIPVIAETSSDPTAAAFADAIWSFDATDLPAAVAALWTDLDAFHAEAARRLARWKLRSAIDEVAAAVAAHTLHA
ncbi:MAG: hypothetical protein IPQ07_23280 [Myxococcales bacterium]|nr:hypothetical protein [Myxococcales bacterium]